MNIGSNGWKTKYFGFLTIRVSFFLNVGCSILPWLSLTSNTPLYLHCLIDVLHSRGKIEHFQSLKKKSKAQGYLGFKKHNKQGTQVHILSFFEFSTSYRTHYFVQKGHQQIHKSSAFTQFLSPFLLKKWLWSCNKKSVKHCSYCFSIRKEKEIK